MELYSVCNPLVNRCKRSLDSPTALSALRKVVAPYEAELRAEDQAAA